MIFLTTAVISNPNAAAIFCNVANDGLPLPCSMLTMVRGLIPVISAKSCWVTFNRVLLFRKILNISIVQYIAYFMRRYKDFILKQAKYVIYCVFCLSLGLWLYAGIIASGIREWVCSVYHNKSVIICASLSLRPRKAYFFLFPSDNSHGPPEERWPRRIPVLSPYEPK